MGKQSQGEASCRHLGRCAPGRSHGRAGMPARVRVARGAPPADGRFQPQLRSAALGGRAGTLWSVPGKGGRFQKPDRNPQTPAMGSPGAAAMPQSAAPALGTLWEGCARSPRAPALSAAGTRLRPARRPHPG